MSIELKDTGVSAEMQADFEAVIEHVQTGKTLDAAVSRRISERAERIRDQILKEQGVQNIGVQIIREMRGPVDEEQERELTLAQRDLLRRGETRLVDPDTGTTYVLVAEEEYDRVRGCAR